MNQSSRPILSGRLARAFTLTELIVAVGAVALLTIGIGQVFSSVNKLVGTGAAIAETNQAARSIEARMREDFASLSRLRAEDTFFAIRSRKVENTYVNRDERDADRRAGLDENSANTAARTRRLDEIIFLGFGGDGGGYASAQIAGGNLSPSPTATLARIYYGQALRPQLDLEFDPEDTSSDRNVPERKWLADGDFGQRAGEISRFESGTPVTGRNEYAGDWTMVRHAMLLYGAEVTGPPATAGAGGRVSVPPEILYAPFARDLETRQRIPVGDWSDASTWERYLVGGVERVPWPRLISHGRVDICAQSPDTLQRWLQGVSPRPTNAVATWAPADATPFDSGRFNIGPPHLISPNSAQEDSPLWERVAEGTTANSPPTPLMIGTNRIGLQAAIAGMFTRILAESDPPLVDRRDPPTGAPPVPDLDPPLSALMDTHAVLGMRCSNFEIAWSEGDVWLESQPYERDVDGDGVIDVRFGRGDLIWFDMNFYRSKGPQPNDDLTDGGRLFPAVPLAEIAEFFPTVNDRQRLSRPDAWNGRIAYDVSATGSAATVNAAARNPQDEYLAIWGYRIPVATPNPPTGIPTEWLPTYGNPWPKPSLIRVRMTLHDSQYRIPGGKQYEFIFAVNLR